MKSLAENIADDITSMIVIEKRFAPGSKILNENEFAKELFISRSTYREAVKILTERGILVVKHGSGTYVNDQINHLISEHEPADKDSIDALDLNEIRLMIEPEATYLATLRATDNELKRISYYANLVEEEITSGVVDRRSSEIRFHLSIARATHNSFMDRLAPTIFDAIDKSWNVFNLEEVRQGTILDHRLIVNYMLDRNADSARTAMRLHMLRGIDVLKSINKTK